MAADYTSTALRMQWRAEGGGTGWMVPKYTRPCWRAILPDAYPSCSGCRTYLLLVRGIHTAQKHIARISVYVAVGTRQA